jgi:hypothetical protein
MLQRRTILGRQRVEEQAVPSIGIQMVLWVLLEANCVRKTYIVDALFADARLLDQEEHISTIEAELAVAAESESAMDRQHFEYIQSSI